MGLLQVPATGLLQPSVPCMDGGPNARSAQLAQSEFVSEAYAAQKRFGFFHDENRLKVHTVGVICLIKIPIREPVILSPMSQL